MTSRRGHGEGSIHKRADGRWCAILDLGWQGGKRSRKYVYGETRHEVVDKLNKEIRARDEGLPALNERTTTAQYLEWWAAESAPQSVKAKTAESYAWIVKRYLVPEIGKVRLARLSPGDVQVMLRRLEERGLSARTRHYARAVLRRALGQAERWGLVARNVAALVDAPKLPAHRTDDALSIEQAKALLAAARGDRLEALVTLALTLGLRRGEALALRWDAVDLDTGTLSVRASLDRVTGAGLVLSEPKTARSRRTVPLPAKCLAALKAHRLRQLSERLTAGARWQDDGYVFTTPIGTPLDPRNVTTWYHALTQRAGLGRRRFHALRHSAATLMLAQGVPLEVISRTLGHAGYAITADVYAHVGAELLRGGAAAMDKALATS